MIVTSSFLKQIRNVPQDTFDEMVRVMEFAEMKDGVLETLHLCPHFRAFGACRFYMGYQKGPHVEKFPNKNYYKVKLWLGGNFRNVARKDLAQAIAIAFDWNRYWELSGETEGLPEQEQFFLK